VDHDRDLHDILNDMDAVEAREKLTHCCGAKRWVDTMLKSRPYRDMAALSLAIDGAFVRLEEADWREAFTHHPKIGDLDGLRKKFQATSHLASKEQAGVAQASDKTLHELADLNRAYEERHGFIFIVCATGKSADEMLLLLKDRLPNDTAREVRIAAGEQRKITHLRLEKLKT